MSTNSVERFDSTNGINKVPTVKTVKNVNEDEISNSKELEQRKLEGKSIPISEEQLIKAIDRAVKAMEGTSTSLEFSIHEKTKHIIVSVLNKETGEVIREIPREKSLDFLAKVWELAGALVDERR